MTYSDFIFKITSAGIPINQKTLDDIDEKLFTHSGKKMVPRYDFICQYFSVGGVSGGSCWETSNPQPYRDDSERPNVFAALDNVLENVCPQITFLQYRKIEPLIQKFEATEYEYYDNRTDYEVWVVNLRSLYDKLLEIGAIEEK